MIVYKLNLLKHLSLEIETKKKLAKDWFLKLRNTICNSIEELERKNGSKAKFKKNKWKHGEFRIIKGKVIEKGGPKVAKMEAKME